MSAQPQQRYISEQEYLELERTSEEKHEYYAGEIFLMSGGTQGHSLIACNIIATLHPQLRRRPCRVYNSDMRVKVEQNGLYVYPDITVVCGEPRFDSGRNDTLLNPTIIIEVFSPSTERHDRGRKFQSYRTLDSLQEYVLVAQDEHRIERFTRHNAHFWVLDEASGLDATMQLTAIECELALADVYEKVELTVEEPGAI